MSQSFSLDEDNKVHLDAEKVSIDNKNNLIIFEGEIKLIIYGSEAITIFGDSGALHSEDRSLIVYGAPATISSGVSLNGYADKLIISIDRSIQLIGNAELVNNHNKVSAELINYQIDLKK